MEIGLSNISTHLIVVALAGDNVNAGDFVSIGYADDGACLALPASNRPAHGIVIRKDSARAEVCVRGAVTGFDDLIVGNFYGNGQCAVAVDNKTLSVK